MKQQIIILNNLFHTLTIFLTTLVPSLATRVTVRLDPDKTTSSGRMETSPTCSQDYFTKYRPCPTFHQPWTLCSVSTHPEWQTQSAPCLPRNPENQHFKQELLPKCTVNSLFNGKVEVFNPDTCVQVPSPLSVRVTCLVAWIIFWIESSSGTPIQDRKLSKLIFSSTV